MNKVYQEDNLPPLDFIDLIDQLNLTQEQKATLHTEIHKLVENWTIEVDVYDRDGMRGLTYKEDLRGRLKRLKNIQKTLTELAESQELHIMCDIVEHDPQVDAQRNIRSAGSHIGNAIQSYEDAISGRKVTGFNPTKKLAERSLIAINRIGDRKLNTTTDREFIERLITRVDVKGNIGEQTIRQLIKPINLKFKEQSKQ